MKNLKWGLCVGMFFVFASCGYQFEGGGYLKKDITRISVRVLENKSSETGAGMAFTNALISEILLKTDTRVVDADTASGVIEGRVNSITFATLSRSTTESVLERRVYASVDLKLIDRQGQVVWSVKNFTSNEDYTVSEDQVADNIRIKEAVDKIANRMAEKLTSSMLNNF